MQAKPQAPQFCPSVCRSAQNWSEQQLWPGGQAPTPVQQVEPAGKQVLLQQMPLQHSPPHGAWQTPPQQIRPAAHWLSAVHGPQVAWSGSTQP
jgi:hypothetical protein